jgi:hypothetical protein
MRKLKNFFEPIRVTERTLKILREHGIEFKPDPLPPLFNIKQVSVEPIKKPVNSLIDLKFEYGSR